MDSAVRCESCALSERSYGQGGCGRLPSLCQSAAHTRKPQPDNEQRPGRVPRRPSGRPPPSTRSSVIPLPPDSPDPVAAPPAALEKAPPGYPLEWSEAYECGHALLDGQHRTLFRDANALLEASQTNSPDVLARFDELISHVLGHFVDEERVLAQIGYPHAAAHCAAHATLTRTALRLREAMIQSHHRHEELLEFLVGDVVRRHLLVDDRRFFELLAAREA